MIIRIQDEGSGKGVVELEQYFWRLYVTVRPVFGRVLYSTK